MNDLRMDLKVCEGCGALWLRAGIAAGVYCRVCSRRLAEYPAPKGRRIARPRRPRHVAAAAALTVVRSTTAQLAGGAR